MSQAQSDRQSFSSPPLPRWQAITATVVIAAVLGVMYAGWVDEIGRRYTETGVKRGLVTYAVARGLNAVISVAQGTEVALQPAGIGVNFTPGQILDPVNDLVERFSWIMLASTTSLGIQRVLLEIAVWPGLTVLITVLATLTVILLWYRRTAPHRWRAWVWRITAVAMILRFAVPVAAILNEGAYHLFLEQRYESSRQALEASIERIQAVNDKTAQSRPPQPSGSWVDEAKRWYQSVAAGLDLRARIEEYKRAAADIAEYIIDVIVIFVLQTILFPLLFLWLTLRWLKTII